MKVIVRIVLPAGASAPAGWPATPGHVERAFKDPFAASAGLLALGGALLAPSPRQRLARLRELERAGGWKLMLHGQLPLLHEATLGMAEEAFAPYPRMWAARILAMCKDDRLPQAEQAWTAFRQRQARVRGQRRLPAWELELLGEIVHGYAGHPPTHERQDDLRRLLREIPEHEAAARGAVYNILLHAVVESGEFARAGHLAERALAEFRQAGSVFGELFVFVQRGLARFRNGRLVAATEDFEAAHRLAARHFEPESELVALPHALLGVAAYERGDFAAAAAALDPALPIIEQGEGWTEPLWLIFRAASGLALKRGTPQAALALLARARRLAHRRGLARLRSLLSLHALDLVEQWQPPQADAITTRLRLRELAGRVTPATSAWQEATLHARLLLAWRERIDDPLHWRGLASAARDAGLAHLGCRALLLQAQSMAHQGATPATIRDVLQQMFDVMDTDTPWQSVIDAPGGQAAWTALPAAAHRGLPTPQRRRARQFAAALRRSHAAALVGASSAPLGAQSREVLQAVAQGLRNKEIARLLGRSENTVKFHLKQLSRKLEAGNRRMLVSRAQALGLVD